MPTCTMQILRLLDNEAIDPEDVQEAKELVDDYILRNQDDFDEFSDPDDLYADLIEKLDNLEVRPFLLRHQTWLDRDMKARSLELSSLILPEGKSVVYMPALLLIPATC